MNQRILWLRLRTIQLDCITTPLDPTSTPSVWSPRVINHASQLISTLRKTKLQRAEARQKDRTESVHINPPPPSPSTVQNNPAAPPASHQLHYTKLYPSTGHNIFSCRTSSSKQGIADRTAVAITVSGMGAPHIKALGTGGDRQARRHRRQDNASYLWAGDVLYRREGGAVVGEEVNCVIAVVRRTLTL